MFPPLRWKKFCGGKKKVRRVAKGDVESEDVYLALGKTDTGRHLTVFFILKKNNNVLPISARDMDSKGLHKTQIL